MVYLINMVYLVNRKIINLFNYFTLLSQLFKCMLISNRTGIVMLCKLQILNINNTRRNK